MKIGTPFFVGVKHCADAILNYMSRNRKYLIAAAALALLFILINRQLVSGHAVPVWDADGQAAPWQMLVADCARSGQILKWNPWTNCGAPDCAEPQVGAFSPICVLIGFITGGTLAGYIIYWLLIWLLGGIGTLLLARHLKAPPWAGFCCAISFMFCGIYTGHAEHMSHVHSFSFLPFIIWRLDSALSSKRIIPAVQAGALWGLSALAGYPGLVIITAFYALVWTVGRSMFPDSNSPSPILNRLSRGIMSLIIMTAVGTIVMSPVYYAFLVGCSGYTDRTGQLTLLQASMNTLHPGALRTIISPYLSTLCLYNASLWSYTDPSSCSIYIAPLMTVLAIMALILRPRRVSWMVLTTALFLSIAVGQNTPLHAILYRMALPFRYFRHPAIFRDFAVFTIAAAAMIGSRDLNSALAQNSSIKPKRLFFIVSLSASLAAISIFFIFFTRVYSTGPFAYPASVHIVSSWALTTAAAALTLYYYKHTRNGVLIIILLCLLSVYDAASSMLLSSQTIYTTDSKVKSDWRKIHKARDTRLDLLAINKPRERKCDIGPGPTNKNIPLRTPVFSGYSAMKNRLHEAWAQSDDLTRLVCGSNFLWFAEQPLQIPETPEGFKHYAALTRQTESIVPTLHSGAGTNTSNTPPQAVRLDAEINTWTPNSLEFRCEVPSDGWVLLTERWAPGWQAEINGQPAKIHKGSFIFRAMKVNKGDTTIKLNYNPPGYPYLLIISWLTLAAAAALPLFQRSNAAEATASTGT